jgi:hypothetical protein
MQWRGEQADRNALFLDFFDQICYVFCETGTMRPALPSGAAGRFISGSVAVWSRVAGPVPGSLLFAVKIAVMPFRKRPQGAPADKSSDETSVTRVGAG